MAIFSAMRRIKPLFYLGLLSFLSLDCVETVISVRLLPDGHYTLRFQSKGDSTDVFDDDFPHPLSDDWTRSVQQQENDGNKVWTLNTHGLFSGSIAFPQGSNSAIDLNHSINVTKTDGWIATHYKLEYRFRGREAFKKYPQFAKQIRGVSSDSTQWISEVLTFIVSAGMDDLQLSVQQAIDPDLAERIKNHIQGYFIHIKEKELFDELSRDFLRNAFGPFLNQLPQDYVESVKGAMAPYEQEWRIPSGLADDNIRLYAFLPGVITTHNADAISGDTLKWKFGLEQFLNDDYNIRAASIVYSPRQIQAVILGLTALFLLFLWIIFKTRNKQ